MSLQSIPKAHSVLRIKVCVSQKKSGARFLRLRALVSFSQLPAVKKDTILGAARRFFGPSYFVTALVQSK